MRWTRLKYLEGRKVWGTVAKLWKERVSGNIEKYVE